MIAHPYSKVTFNPSTAKTRKGPNQGDNNFLESWESGDQFMPSRSKRTKSLTAIKEALRLRLYTAAW